MEATLLPQLNKEGVYARPGQGLTSLTAPEKIPPNLTVLSSQSERPEIDLYRPNTFGVQMSDVQASCLRHDRKTSRFNISERHLEQFVASQAGMKQDQQYRVIPSVYPVFSRDHLEQPLDLVDG